MSHEKEKHKIATDDVRVSQFEPVDAPDIIKAEIPITPKAAALVLEGRNEIRSALTGKNKRILVITGPCSIHDADSAFEYAGKLRALQDDLQDKMLIVMRVYFEKPRTTVGWKGLINDPKLDNSGDINTGLRKAREILLEINSLGLFAATEFLDPIVPQYTADLVTWAAIGARTTESQTHREMASGLSMPVGFKNSTDGDLQTALDAMVSARHGHSFLGIDQTGRTAIVRTKGNPDVHLVLRGGNGKPNYSPAHIAFAREAIKMGSDLPRSILVDCSHGNSGKDYRKQPDVFEQLIQQIVGGDKSILGMMLESNLSEGSQKMAAPSQLRRGVSITDGCIDWATTEKLLRTAHQNL
jgi:3-deoxy-7-phosphoheptulonate synthase